jgi:hypothetical protein
MNNIENDAKIKLLRQIYDYESKGLTLNRRSVTMSNDIEELQFHFLLLQNDEREFHIKKELQFYELLFKLTSDLTDKPIPPKEELLKLCFGSKEYYEHHKQQKCNKNNQS